MRNTSMLVVVCLILVAAAAGAQVPTGTISGRVVSSDEAPLPGVTVTVTSPSLQGDRTVVTTENGDFVLTLLPPGDYTIVFELSGFQSLRKQVGLAGTRESALRQGPPRRAVELVGRATRRPLVIGLALPHLQSPTEVRQRASMTRVRRQVDDFLRVRAHVVQLLDGTRLDEDPGLQWRQPPVLAQAAHGFHRRTAT